jgi:hypothetical protein
MLHTLQIVKRRNSHENRTGPHTYHRNPCYIHLRVCRRRRAQTQRCCHRVRKQPAGRMRRLCAQGIKKQKKAKPQRREDRTGKGIRPRADGLLRRMSGDAQRPEASAAVKDNQLPAAGIFSHAAWFDFPYFCSPRLRDGAPRQARCWLGGVSVSVVSICFPAYRESPIPFVLLRVLCCKGFLFRLWLFSASPRLRGEHLLHGVIILTPANLQFEVC